jgi:hypothetical protein
MPIGNPQQAPPTAEESIRLWKGRLKDYPPWKVSTELEFQYSFPADELAEKDIYLWEPHGIACDAEGNVYVSDQKQKSILKFDSKGRFLLKKGQKGQGPGDFLNPYCLCVSGKTVFVGDTVRRDVQIFDLDLNLIKSFKVPKSYTNLVAGPGGLIFATPFRMGPDQPLVDVLNGDGVLQYSFGKPMFGNENWQIYNFVKLDVDKTGDVFLAFEHWPTVCRYSAKGELKAVYKIHHKGMEDAQRINQERMNDPDNNRYMQAIFAFRATENGFFILHNYPIAEVLELDENGRPINDFWTVRSHDYFAFDFIVRGIGNNDRIEILLVERSPDSRIEVFRRKE